MYWKNQFFICTVRQLTHKNVSWCQLNDTALLQRALPFKKNISGSIDFFTKNRYLIFSDPCHCQSTENSDKLTLPFKLQDLRLALDNVTSHCCCCRRRCRRYRVPLPGAATATANRLLLTNVSVSLKKIIAFSLVCFLYVRLLVCYSHIIMRTDLIIFTKFYVLFVLYLHIIIICRYFQQKFLSVCCHAWLPTYHPTLWSTVRSSRVLLPSAATGCRYCCRHVSPLLLQLLVNWYGKSLTKWLFV